MLDQALTSTASDIKYVARQAAGDTFDMSAWKAKPYTNATRREVAEIQNFLVGVSPSLGLSSKIRKRTMPQSDSKSKDPVDIRVYMEESFKLPLIDLAAQVTLSHND